MAKMKVKGEAVTTLEYTPGERLAESRPPDEGPATLQLGQNKNLAGIGKGWKAKPGKYPNRLLWFKVLDTEDEISGKEKEVRELISLSPGALRRGCMRLAQAAQYPLKIQLGPDKTPNHPTVRANAIAIDKMLMHIRENELTLRGEIYHEEWNGEMQGNVKWLPPEELSGEEQMGEEGEAEPTGDDDVFGSSEVDEEVAEDAEAEGEAEEASETDEVEDAEIVEDVEEAVEDEAVEEEFEAVPPPRKKVAAPAKKVVQPGQKKPALKAPVKKKK